MVKGSKSNEWQKSVFPSPLSKAIIMEKEEETSSNIYRIKYTNIKNEMNYDTTSISSTFKDNPIEKGSSGQTREDDKNIPWTTITPNNEIYFDWTNSIDNSSKIDSHGTSAVELVVAVKSAIQQRQDILEEWKKKAEGSISELYKVKKDNLMLEDSLQQKDTLITKLTKELSGIQNQYNTMNDESSSLKNNYESARLEKDKLNSLYHCALQELSDARKKLSNSEEQRDKLERRFRIQEEENEHWFKKGEHIEAELNVSKTTISNLRSEIVELEEKLIILQNQVSTHITTEKNENESINKLKIKLTKSLDELKCEIENNKSNTNEIVKMQALIEKLENDKCDIKKMLDQAEYQQNTIQCLNSNLQTQLIESKDKTATIQNSCQQLQTMVNDLEQKLNKYEVENNELKCKLGKSKTECDNLQEELEKLEHQLNENQSQLKCYIVELESQKSMLSEAHTNISMLQNEKISITKQLKLQEDVDKKRSNELTRLLSDNKSLKQMMDNIRAELTSKCDLLIKAQNEAKYYQSQLKSIEDELLEERSKHNAEMLVIHEKAKVSNDYWKNYVEKEICQIKQTYMEKLHKHCEEYSSIIAQSNSRDVSFGSEQPIISSELADEIGYLKKQLSDSTKKLEGAINQAETTRKQMLEKSSKEQQNLIEKLTPAKNLDKTYITDLESRIQSIMSHFIDDNNVFHQFELENKNLKEKLEKYKKKYESNKAIDIATKELQAERDQLRIDIGHSKNLTSLAEETADRLQQDLTDLQRKLDEKSESIEHIKADQILMNKNLGMKDAQIKLLNQTIENLKNKINEYEKNSSNVKFLMDNIEHDKLMYEKDIYLSKSEISELRCSLEHAKNSKKDISALNEKLNRELYELRVDIKSKSNDIQVHQQTIQNLQQKLNASLSEIDELKTRVKNASVQPIQDDKNFKELMDKFVDSNKKINKLQQQINQLNNESKNMTNIHQSQIKSFENDCKSKANEIRHFNELIHSENVKNKQLQECLNTTEDILTELIRIFDCYILTVTQTLNIPHECISESLSVNHNECIEKCVHNEKFKQLQVYEQKINQIKDSLTILVDNEHLLTQRFNQQSEQQHIEVLSSEKKINSQKLQLEHYQQIIKSKQEEFDKIHQQLIDIQLLQSSQSDDLSKSISEHLERQRYAISVSEENKNSVKMELVNVNRKMQCLIADNRELEAALQDTQSTCSMYQITIVTLEGEIENLNLKLKESSERDIEQNDLISKITSNNRDLNDQLLKSKYEIQKLQNLLAEKEQSPKEVSNEDSSNTCPNKHCCVRSKCVHLHSSLADMELQTHLLQEKLESSQKNEHMSRLNMVSMEDKIKSLNTKLDAMELEKASLEGWVQHLQKLLQDNNTNNIHLNNSPANRQSNNNQENDVLQYKGKIKQLEIDNNHLQKKLDQLGQQIASLQATKVQYDQHKQAAERDGYEKKYVQIKKMFDEKEVEIINLKSEINAIKQRYLKHSELSKKSEDNNNTVTDINLDKRVTACVVTYSHKSDSKNSSFSRDSQSMQHQQPECLDYKCDECDMVYEFGSIPDHGSQKMMPIIDSSVISASSQMQMHFPKDSQSGDDSKGKSIKKKLSRRKKTIL